jgi:hypothetical protein
VFTTQGFFRVAKCHINKDDDDDESQCFALCDVSIVDTTRFLHMTRNMNSRYGISNGKEDPTEWDLPFRK